MNPFIPVGVSVPVSTEVTASLQSVRWTCWIGFFRASLCQALMFNSLQRCLDSGGSAPILTCRHTGTNTYTHAQTLAYMYAALLRPLNMIHADVYAHSWSYYRWFKFISPFFKYIYIYLYISCHLLLCTVQSKQTLCKQKQTQSKKKKKVLWM